MQVQIKHRFTDAILFQCDTPAGLALGPQALRHALEKAVESDANLSGANLSGANLSAPMTFGSDELEVVS